MEGGRSRLTRKPSQTDPNNAVYYFHRARVRFFTGDYAHALEDAGSATALEPKNGEAFLLLGDLDDSMKNPRKAVADYTRAIELGVKTRWRLQRPRGGAHRTAANTMRPSPTTRWASSCAWIIRNPSAGAAISTTRWAAFATLSTTTTKVSA